MAIWLTELEFPCKVFDCFQNYILIFYRNGQRENWRLAISMDVSSLVHLFFNNPTFSDITMVINDEPLYLHKIILAQVKFSAVF